MAKERTGSSAIFEQRAVELIERLQRDTSVPAREMAAEATELAAVFRTWLDERPPDDLRIAKIQQLFSLNRRAMEYLGRPTDPPRR